MPLGVLKDDVDPLVAGFPRRVKHTDLMMVKGKDGVERRAVCPSEAAFRRFHVIYTLLNNFSQLSDTPIAEIVQSLLVYLPAHATEGVLSAEDILRYRSLFESDNESQVALYKKLLPGTASWKETELVLTGKVTGADADLVNFHKDRMISFFAQQHYATLSTSGHDNKSSVEVRTLQRLDRLAAARVDFANRGMLGEMRGASSAALGHGMHACTTPVLRHSLTAFIIRFRSCD